MFILLNTANSIMPIVGQVRYVVHGPLVFLSCLYQGPTLCDITDLFEASYFYVGVKEIIVFCLYSEEACSCGPTKKDEMGIFN